MKIEVLTGVHHRISSGVSLSYSPGVYSVPKAIGDALIERGAAKVVRKKPRRAKEIDHGNG
jgi:hypothetical protein